MYQRNGLCKVSSFSENSPFLFFEFATYTVVSWFRPGLDEFCCLARLESNAPTQHSGIHSGYASQDSSTEARHQAMKFKVLSRSERQFTRDRRDDLLKVHRNHDPKLHPFEQAREYTRALNAAKLDKVFAKPFVGALEGHMDGVFSMTNNKMNLVSFVSGACDGEIKVWDLPSQRNVWSAVAHTGFVRGLSAVHSGGKFYSCGDDKTIKLWSFVPNEEEMGALSIKNTSGVRKKIIEPSVVLSVDYPVLNVDCHWHKNIFASCGSTLDVWDSSRNDPIHTFNWGVDSINYCAFNPAEQDLIATAASDRSIGLYDIRQKSALRKIVMNMTSNCISWNPMEPFRFVVANEDHNCYTFDIRNFKRPVVLHRSHVGAVLSVSFSPTGKEFVSGSYDKTLRIYEAESWTAREVYHTKRMQRLFCVNYSADVRFVLSGSDDTNIRIWKARANDKISRKLSREERSLNYSERLVNRYKNAEEVRRIVKHRHLPKNLYKQVKKRRIMVEADMRKEQNRIKHSRCKLHKVPEKDKPVVKEVE